jgi:hypothetical protein
LSSVTRLSFFPGLHLRSCSSHASAYRTIGARARAPCMCARARACTRACVRAGGRAGVCVRTRSGVRTRIALSRAALYHLARSVSFSAVYQALQYAGVLKVRRALTVLTGTPGYSRELASTHEYLRVRSTPAEGRGSGTEAARCSARSLSAGTRRHAVTWRSFCATASTAHQYSQGTHRVLTGCP